MPQADEGYGNETEPEPVEDLDAVEEPLAVDELGRGERPEREEPVGVPICDEFLDKYEACVTRNVPPPHFESIREGMREWREAWRAVAASPGGVPSLEKACRQTLEAQRQATAALGCEW